MALLRNSSLKRALPFPGWVQTTQTISAVPRAEKRFISDGAGRAVLRKCVGHLTPRLDEKKAF